VLVQLGEGATNIGAFHESLNLAAIWHLPIVFQVINNRYGMGTSVEMASAEPEQWKRAAAYRMHGERVDGNDLLAVREAADRLMRRARDERRPALLETTTYRFRGHSVADAGKVYRAAEEVAEAKSHDPIDRFVAQMGIDAESVARLRADVNAEIDAAIRQAAADPAPDPAGLYDNVYGDPAWREQFSRMERGGPFGEREGTRGWRA
jgi:pyruvate dehydrogenase E1 component alpha subunit